MTRYKNNTLIGISVIVMYTTLRIQTFEMAKIEIPTIKQFSSSEPINRTCDINFRFRYTNSSSDKVYNDKHFYKLIKSIKVADLPFLVFIIMEDSEEYPSSLCACKTIL